MQVVGKIVDIRESRDKAGNELYRLMVKDRESGLLRCVCKKNGTVLEEFQDIAGVVTNIYTSVFGGRGEYTLKLDDVRAGEKAAV